MARVRLACLPKQADGRELLLARSWLALNITSPAVFRPAAVICLNWWESIPRIR
jgi:hypothetical protein